MSINQISSFLGLLPDASSPATFDARANAIFDWLVTSLVSDFNQSAGQVSAALGGSATLLDRFNALGDLAGKNRVDLVFSRDDWSGGEKTFNGLISPWMLRDAMSKYQAARQWHSAWSDFVHLQTLSFEHGLGSVPRHVSIEYRCKVAVYGFAVGDVIQGAFMVEGDGSNEGVGVVKSDTHLDVLFAGNGAGLAVRRDGESFIVKDGHWQFRVSADL